MKFKHNHKAKTQHQQRSLDQPMNVTNPTETYSYTYRMPLETAIEIVEQLTTSSGIDRQVLHEMARQRAGSYIIWWVDHAISLLRTHGYVRRHNLSYGTVVYTPTARWDERDDLLAYLRPPRKKNRYARDQARINARVNKQSIEIQCLPANFKPSIHLLQSA
jgi:hypothetical protein